MVVGDAHLFPGFLTPILHNFLSKATNCFFSHFVVVREAKISRKESWPQGKVFIRELKVRFKKDISKITFFFTEYDSEDVEYIENTTDPIKEAENQSDLPQYCKELFSKFFSPIFTFIYI